MTEVSEDLRQQRLNKLSRLREAGIDPYPARVSRSHSLAAALQDFDRVVEEGREVTLAGRLVSLRAMGKATFAHLMDGTGRLQIYLRADRLGTEQYDLFKLVDIGDFLAVRGTMFRTRTGEATVETQAFCVLAKTLLPLPEKWHGLSDTETRYRQRYLDLIASEETREVFRKRSAAVGALRRFLDERGFAEVETPILQPLYGGAAAKPFTTYHNALDRELFLRIASELYLKRLIVGGLDRVYEIGKNFRNEGISTKHNPEFTVMECYQAYADYEDMMALVEQMFAYIAHEVLGSSSIEYQGQSLDFAPPWRRLTLREAVLEYAGIDFLEYPEKGSLAGRMRELGITFEATASWGKLIDELLATYVEPHLIQPTFLLDYPLEVSPLAKKKRDDPRLVERFEAFVAGMEMANAFSELNDPLDQSERLRQQAKERAAGDEEAQPMDEDFVLALEHGMPPTGGLGVGVDRLIMLLSNQSSIREVILFPQLRSRA